MSGKFEHLTQLTTPNGEFKILPDEGNAELIGGRESYWSFPTPERDLDTLTFEEMDFAELCKYMITHPDSPIPSIELINRKDKEACT